MKLKVALAALLVAVAAALAFFYSSARSNKQQHSAALTQAEVERFCSACHVFTPPEILSKRGWRTVLDKMYALYIPDPPPSGRMLPHDEIEAWFVKRAKSGEALLGTSAEHRARVADLLEI